MLQLSENAAAETVCIGTKRMPLINRAADLARKLLVLVQVLNLRRTCS